MCGILGVVGEIPRAVFDGALSRIAHRGPDDGRVMMEFGPAGPVTLGHRRLAIIDLTDAGAQPMVSSDGRFVIVYNGEIYNYKELRVGLERDGLNLRSQSDTEVLLELFVRRGPEIFKNLNGIFAVAIYDRETGALTLARDHLGVKPLYYARYAGGFAFSSEIKALLGLGVPAKVNGERLGEYLAQMWVQEPDTMFAGVSKLPAGGWASLREGQLTVERFWEVAAPGARPPDAPLEELQALLSEAVARQMVADRPIGTYVSGGVDSSLVTHLALQHQPALLSVSARFSKGDRHYEGVSDDGEWSERFIARYPGLRSQTLELDSGLFDTYKELVWAMDEPIADAAIVPAYLLARKARESGAVVMLSGMGGDELFGGYRRYSALQSMGLANSMPGPAREAILAAATTAQRLPAGPWRILASHAQRYFQVAHDNWPLTYMNLIGYFTPHEVDDLVGETWRAPYGEKLGAILRGFEDAPRSFQAQLLDLKGFLASHNLMYVDKASMGASVEVRVPLLDPRIAEFAFRLPEALRATKRQEKILLKELCAKLVDPAIAYRQKAGFAMPVRSWMRGPLRNEVQRAVTSGRIAELFPRASMKRLFDDHVAGRRENTFKLWTLLTLELWLERFAVDTGAAA